VPTELQVFKQLDDIDCQISLCDIIDNETRPIFSQFAHSKQATYVRVLKIRDTIITSPSLFQSMTCLQKLEIDNSNSESRWPIDLTEYLNASPPTLFDFSVRCAELEISELPADPSNIGILSIDCNNLSEKLIKLISDFFPKCVYLYLKGGMKENMTIDLSTNDFADLWIETYYDQVPHGFSVSSYGSPVKYYVGKQAQENYISTNVDPATAEELQDRVTIEIKYGIAGNLTS
jgi:hypothetical protein